MDAVERLIGRRWEGVTARTFLKFGHLDPQIQRHLQRVYATLSAALVVSALGCFADIHYNIAGVLTFLAAWGCLVGLAFTSSIPATLNKRYAMLAGFSFCQGAGLGKLVGLAIDVDPSLLLTAFLGTAAVFVCFSLASLLAARRSMLFLGGWLASAISCLMVLQLGAWIAGGRGGARLSMGAELYGGLLVFAGYVLFDTQIIVEKAGAGYTDHVKAALDLLVDVIAIFTRLLIIIIRNKQNRAEQERRRSSDKNRKRD